MQKLDLKCTGLVLVDMQNDFLHPQGAYGRARQTCAAINVLPRRLQKVANTVRRRNGWIISTHFTLVPGKNDEPFIDDHLKKLRPFLSKGDFAPGSFGQALIDDLQPADLMVEKVTYSAFYQSRLEWMLNRAGLGTLIIGGIVTNGGIASTARDAHVRNFNIIILSDGCAAFSEEAHNATIASLSTIAEIMTCKELIAGLE